MHSETQRIKKSLTCLLNIMYFSTRTPASYCFKPILVDFSRLPQHNRKWRRVFAWISLALLCATARGVDKRPERTKICQCIQNMANVFNWISVLFSRVFQSLNVHKETGNEYERDIFHHYHLQWVFSDVLNPDWNLWDFLWVH